MFDFERLEVYRKIRELNKVLLPFIFSIQSKHPYLADQLKRASLSVMLNLSEGAGRMSARDKVQFFIRARASVYECVSVLHILIDLNIIPQGNYDKLYDDYEQVSKMLLALIRSTKVL